MAGSGTEGRVSQLALREWAGLIAKVFARTGDLDRVLIFVFFRHGVHDQANVPELCRQGRAVFRRDSRPAPGLYRVYDQMQVLAADPTHSKMRVTEQADKLRPFEISAVGCGFESHGAHKSWGYSIAGVPANH
jgi:hypothetical protein